MLECPYCFRVFRTAPEKLGARCPKCRMPMYERPGRRKAPEHDLGPCAQHPQSPAVANCARCNRLMCNLCRTRWHDDATCPDCVERSLLSDEPTPQETQRHQRQAWMAVVLGAVGWFILILTLWPASGLHQGAPSRFLLWLAGGLFVISLGPAVLALGQAAAAMRQRGTAHRVAVWGLALSGSHVGLILGLLVMNLWHN